MSRRKQDPGAAQPTLFIYQGHEITSWALHAIHSARAPSPHFLRHLYGSLSTSASWVRQKLPDCSPASFTASGWEGCCCHTKIHLAKSWPSFGSAVRIKAQSWTKYCRCWWAPTGHLSGFSELHPGCLDRLPAAAPGILYNLLGNRIKAKYKLCVDSTSF